MNILVNHLYYSTIQALYGFSSTDVSCGKADTRRWDLFVHATSWADTFRVTNFTGSPAVEYPSGLSGVMTKNDSPLVAAFFTLNFLPCKYCTGKTV